MGCDEYEFGKPGEGGVAIICQRGQRRKRCGVTGCSNPADLLCDYPLAGPKAGQTCDKQLCRRHATKIEDVTRLIAPNLRKIDTVDYCPAHAELAKQQELTK